MQLVQPAAQPRPALGLHQLLVRRAVAGAGLLQAPLALEQRALVQPGRVLLELDALDDPGAPERRGRAPGCRWRRRSGPRPPRAASSTHGVSRVARTRRCLSSGRIGAGDAALDRDQGVHQAQALERVAGVADFALVDLVQVLLDVGAGQGGAAEDDRVVGGQLALVELLQVLLHDHRGLHQQTGHADDIGPVLLGGLQDRGDRLLDAEVDDVVAVVGQDDVDEVLADVVDVAADGGQHDRALALRRRTSPCAARGRRPRSS